MTRNPNASGGSSASSPAYREDGEFDGERNYVIYRKNMAGAENRRSPAAEAC